MVEHLYIHIPFCLKICPYCSFYKETANAKKAKPFVDALLREARERSRQLRPKTIFFGGGTPSALSVNQLAFLLQGLRETLDCSEVGEWSFEMNPATVTKEKAKILREYGVNRISIGVQSWNPRELKVLGRVHTVEQAEKSIAVLREAGFDNINVDLIYSVPGQTKESWKESLSKSLGFRPEHISAYCLTYEEDTEFFRRMLGGEWTPDEVLDADLFVMTREALAAAGYRGYEISNFSLAGRECVHNLAYWEGKDFIGLGPGAFSTVGERRWRNAENTQSYIEKSQDGEALTDFEEAVGGKIRKNERVAFGLRMDIGVERGWVNTETAERLLAAGLIVDKGERYSLSERGLLVADSIAEEVMEF